MEVKVGLGRVVELDMFITGINADKYEVGPNNGILAVVVELPSVSSSVVMGFVSLLVDGGGGIVGGANGILSVIDRQFNKQQTRELLEKSIYYSSSVDYLIGKWSEELVEVSVLDDY